MQLPASILAAIDERAGAVPFRALRRAAEELSGAYRARESARARLLPSPERVAAYLVTRMPATYAAAAAALRAVGECLGQTPITSLLDAGAGSGAATLAARERFPQLEQLTLLEPDPHLADAGRQWLPEAAWIPRDLRRPEPLPERDLVLAGYVLGELSESDAMAVAERLWRAAQVVFVLIEPGTPPGFALVRAVRDKLLAAGAHMVAPCPTAAPCPITGADWCHFAQRLERSSLHRRIKGGELGFEDEKYSYVALAKHPASPAPGRIVRHPQHHPGLIALEVCVGTAIERANLRRADRERFRAARRAAWGDAWRA